MSETSEHKIERLEDVIWKLEKQMDDIGEVAARLRGLLNAYNESLQLDESDCFSCGIMGFDEDAEIWVHNTGCELAEELKDD